MLFKRQKTNPELDRISRELDRLNAENERLKSEIKQLHRTNQAWDDFWSYDGHPQEGNDD